MAEEKSLLSFTQLSSFADSLNKASDEFSKVVGGLNKALQRLNVGLEVWVTYTKWNGDDGSYGSEQIGYTKLAGNWGIAIRAFEGFQISQGDDLLGEWAFNDAPREMRLKAVEKLPELVDALGKEAKLMTEKIHKKLADTKAFAAAIGITEEPVSGVVTKVRK